LFYFYNCTSFFVLLFGHFSTDYSLLSPARDDFFSGCEP
jgi:hypothetical protein